ncbi:hypothetical protein [Rickettsia endosymbiont of Orchestes rusci]|uniref:hypothetical protein n=1 Tax=Rickettsia endosymbiont of Orchestes rusci TaxID=3066250 RepID=UPI00313B32C6
MPKQVQHDKEKSGFPPLARMTPRAFLTIHATTPVKPRYDTLLVITLIRKYESTRALPSRLN